MSQLYDLSRPFPAKYIQSAPAGKHGDYVSHSTVNEALLYDLGPFSFELIELIRGIAPEIKSSNNTWPAREDAVVGAICRLSVTIDGVPVTITVAGDVEQPAMNNDGANAKLAESDALKRAGMRIGKGLHLWSQNDYFLARALRERGDGPDGPDDDDAS